MRRYLNRRRMARQSCFCSDAWPSMPRIFHDRACPLSIDDAVTRSWGEPHQPRAPVTHLDCVVDAARHAVSCSESVRVSALLILEHELDAYDAAIEAMTDEAPARRPLDAEGSES